MRIVCVDFDSSEVEVVDIRRKGINSFEDYYEDIRKEYDEGEVELVDSVDGKEVVIYDGNRVEIIYKEIEKSN